MLSLETSNKKYFIFITIISTLLLMAILLMELSNPSLSASIESGSEVEKNSELIYYLNVTYDGIDKEGINSEDGTVANVNSNIIYVEDKIPEGLEFTGFVTTNNGSIGAYEKNTNNSCLGKVVDDTPNSNGEWNQSNTEYTYHGLHYNTNNRLVSFKVENLQSGCVLTVGIKTKTPSEIDDPDTDIVENRRDFYNYGTAQEDDLTTNSNITHVYMGSKNAQLYPVSYQYTGIIPENAPDLPVTTTYTAGTQVGVASNAVFNGYSFSGWTSSDVTITNGTFEMPEKQVVLKGSFTELPKYKVTYLIEGNSPLNYMLPKEKEYYENEMVKLDVLEKGTIINGYSFNGWESENVTFTNNSFEMPSTNVNIKGSFSEVKYKVEFEFYDSVLPSNSDELLPETLHVLKGEKVTLPEITNEVEGYAFLGWYHDNEFLMPEENIKIYGEWKEVLGTFEPSINQTLLSENKSYKPNEEVKFKVTVSNNNDFALENVMIKKNLKDATITGEDNYTIESNEFIKFERLEPQETVEFIISYTTTKDDYDRLDSIVEIISSQAENRYEMINKEYKSVVSVNLTNKTSNPKTGVLNYGFILVLFIIIPVIGIAYVSLFNKKQEL